MPFALDGAAQQAVDGGKGLGIDVAGRARRREPGMPIAPRPGGDLVHRAVDEPAHYCFLPVNVPLAAPPMSIVPFMLLSLSTVAT